MVGEEISIKQLQNIVHRRKRDESRGFQMAEKSSYATYLVEWAE